MKKIAGKTKFSIIICSIDSSKFAQAYQHYRNLFKESTYEIIGIHDAKSLAEGYNRGITQSSGEILIFSHDDIIIADDNFAKKISSRLKHFDLLGFAGATRVVSGKWVSAANQFLRGVVAHAPKKSRSIHINVFGLSDWPVSNEIKVIDGLCMVATRRLVQQVQFDHKTFNGFHLYDLDFSFSSYLAGFNIGVCCDIPIIHESGGTFSGDHAIYCDRFENKFKGNLDSIDYSRKPNTSFCGSKICSDISKLNDFWQEESLRHILSDFQHTALATEFDHAHQDWLNKRAFIETDTLFLAKDVITHPEFNILIRLGASESYLLADTLDALSQQVDERWILDILTELPSPSGIEDVINIRWHTVSSLAHAKHLLDDLVVSSPCNWVIEIPAGVRPDILYLARLAREIQHSPDVKAFYVDDDCCDENQARFSSRYKPNVNPGHLLSADLAGPLCISKQGWLESGGASHLPGSPWYGHLIRIADTFGWHSIAHIPDILLSYFKRFPSDTESCISALADTLKSKGISADVLHATSNSWNIHYTPAALSPITVAVLSQGQLEFIIRCVSSLLKNTQYPQFEILIVTHAIDGDLDYYNWLSSIEQRTGGPQIRVVFSPSDSSYATLCNKAIASASHELIVLLREEAVVVQERWLEELSRAAQIDDAAAVSPLIHSVGNANIASAGHVFGMTGEFSSPYSAIASLGDAGYLDCLKVTRDISAPSSSCILVRKSCYQQVGGMDAEAYGNFYGEIDLSLKFRTAGLRCLLHPRASVVFGGETSEYDLGKRLDSLSRKREASRTLRQRWGTQLIKDPYWNPNLSLSSSTPLPETEFRAQWQYLPSDKPRILANPLGNGQGDYRITSPLTAIRKAGLAMECVWRQKIEDVARYFTAAEIAQLDPTTVIIQNYIHDISLAALDDWRLSSAPPFIVYTLDDLINDLDLTNPFRKHIPPNARSRFKYALERCDRLVLSTEYLADTYRHFISDIKVVPNRLEREVWLPLTSQRRSGDKPRIGWAGGSTHQGDLMLLKEIIEQTRGEADWIFFGMCPDEIRPLLAEYHDLVSFANYPAHLASLNLDIAVAPLAHTPFNQGKSNLRLLEYGVLGIPVVCTDIDPYQNSPACRVTNTPNAWIAALRERIHDPDAREREGDAMLEWVRRHYILEDHLEEWLAAHLPTQ